MKKRWITGGVVVTITVAGMAYSFANEAWDEKEKGTRYTKTFQQTIVTISEEINGQVQQLDEISPENEKQETESEQEYHNRMLDELQNLMKES